MYKYFQLLDDDYNEIVKGNDNPANICDCEDGRTAAKIARQWMRDNSVRTAQLVINVLTADGCDNIHSIRELSVSI